MGLAETKRKVQDILTNNLATVGIRGQDTFTVRNGSAQAFVEIHETEDTTWVRLVVPLLRGVTDSPELHKFIAYHDEYRVGRFNLVPLEDGSALLFFSHVLLGDYLDEPELLHALFGMLSVADEIDEELQARFGGVRFHED